MRQCVDIALLGLFIGFAVATFTDQQGTPTSNAPNNVDRPQWKAVSDEPQPKPHPDQLSLDDIANRVSSTGEEVKRRMMYRTDLGKRDDLEYAEDEEEPEVEEKRRYKNNRGGYSSFKADLGKRYSMFRSDLGKRLAARMPLEGGRPTSWNADDDEEGRNELVRDVLLAGLDAGPVEEDAPEKRRYMFRNDLGK